MARLHKIWNIFKKIYTAIFGVIFALFFTFYSWDDLSINSVCVKTMILASVLLFCVFVSFIIQLFTNKETIWKRGKGSVAVKYGDLLKDSFSNKSCFNKPKAGLYVIPVNTHFDTIVEDETVSNSLVTSGSIHGRWLNTYVKEMGYNGVDKIEDAIFQDLDSRSIPFNNDDNRLKGSKRLYKSGTCCIVKGKDSRNFLLVALSEFNCSNNAYATKDDVVDCTRKILDFVNKCGQGKKCYIPLMGTGNSRANLSHKESLHTLLTTMDLYNNLIISPIEIVIYDKDSDKVSIFDK